MDDKYTFILNLITFQSEYIKLNKHYTSGKLKLLELLL